MKMAYDAKKFGKNAVAGGPYEDSGAVVRKGNSPRPQSYTGRYTFDIAGNLSRPSDDGAEHPGIAPKQGFRKELPPAAKSGDSLLDGACDGGGAPDTDAIFRKHR
jgi:hypothetical protein